MTLRWTLSSFSSATLFQRTGRLSGRTLDSRPTHRNSRLDPVTATVLLAIVLATSALAVLEQCHAPVESGPTAYTPGG
jgi:hypothetical protein